MMIVKRIGSVFVSLSMIISVAVPSGAVFAIGESPSSSGGEASAAVASVVDTPLVDVPSSEVVSPVTQTVEPGVAQASANNPQKVAVVAEPQQVLPAQTPSTQTAASSQTIMTQSVEPVVTTPETTPSVIVTSLNVSTTVEYLELFNQTDNPQLIDSLRIIASRTGEPPCELHLQTSGWIMGREFFSVSSPSLQVAMEKLSGDCSFSDTITRVEVYNGATRLQLIEAISSPAGKSWLRHKSTVSTSCVDKTPPSSLKQSGSAANDYIYCSAMPLVEDSHSLRTSELYTPPASSAGLAIVEIMSDSRSCAPTDTGMDCYDFIKVKNTSDSPINLAEYRLRIGASTSASSSSNTFHWHQPTLHPLRDELLLLPGDYLAITKKDNGDPISVTNGDGSVWIEDYFGTKVYLSVSYSDMDLAAAANKSWIIDDQGIGTYGIPSPNGPNVTYIPSLDDAGQGSAGGELKPCRDDQYRSEETNRCRTIVTASSTLKPCKDGQYRSEETNRCRSIASAAASVLKPCADDQFRSPETNRCRKIASSEELPDCGEGRERNPVTNRCRNIVASSIPTADFPVEPLKQSGQALAGWWVFGGVALLAVGYATWEWRREIIRAIRTLGAFFVGGK